MESTQNSNPTGPKNNILIPISIVVAGALIAGALFAAQIINGNKNSNNVAAGPENPHLEVNLTPISAADHIRGDANAPIKIVEFSDTDCPFCQMFHPTVKSLVDKYPGKVAWVYRHFNTQIPSHPNTEIEARATECVASLGGNDKFWQFLDLLYAKKDFTKNPAVLIATTSLPTHAASVGVNRAQFVDCLNKNQFADRVAENTQNAQASGGSGTPFSIVVLNNKVSPDLKLLIEATNEQYTSQYQGAPDIAFVSKDEKMIVLNGAMPQEFMDQIFQILVK
jgi:protein-disulfide isomerase